MKHYRVCYLMPEWVFKGNLYKDIVASRHFDDQESASNFARDVNKDYKVIGMNIVDEAKAVLMPYEEYINGEPIYSMGDPDYGHKLK